MSNGKAINDLYKIVDDLKGSVESLSNEVRKLKSVKKYDDSEILKSIKNLESVKKYDDSEILKSIKNLESVKQVKAVNNEPINVTEIIEKVVTSAYITDLYKERK